MLIHQGPFMSYGDNLSDKYGVQVGDTRFNWNTWCCFSFIHQLKKKYPLIPNLLKTRWVSELFYDSFTKTPGHWNWRKMKNVSFTLISPNDASLFRTSTFQTRDLKCICHGTDVGPVPWQPITHLPTGLIAAYKGGTHGHYSSKGFPIIKLFLTNMIYDVVSEAWKKLCRVQASHRKIHI